jgi:phenylalanyl-tRNA synthetase beta subunit
VIYEENESLNQLEPKLKYDTFEVEIDYVCKLLGVKLSPEEIQNSAKKMGLVPVDSSDKQKFVKF